MIVRKQGFPKRKGEVKSMMKQHEFAKGMTMGVMAGVAMGIAMVPRKRTNVKKAAEKAMKTVGQVMEDLSDEMGLH
jgi:gas vesicle protein